MLNARTIAKRLALAAISLVHLSCWSAVVWNEGTQGDLSDDRLAPTSLALGVGGNDLFATSGGGDLEYVTLVVPDGHLLSNVFLRSYAGDDGTAFLGLQTGTTFTVAPGVPNANGLLGWTHFGRVPGNIGADILPAAGSSGLGAQGFTPPLPANSYTLWLQQLGFPAAYQFDFVVSPVPEPLSGSLCAAGLLVAAWATRRFRR